MSKSYSFKVDFQTSRFFEILVEPERNLPRLRIELKITARTGASAYPVRKGTTAITLKRALSRRIAIDNVPQPTMNNL